jgi:dolichyl-phosphate-mannose-protein mannosyltransferase
MLPPVIGPDSDEGAVTREVPLALRKWRPDSLLTSWLWTAAVVAVAAVLRFWALSFPHGKSFDELYYATEAQELLRYGYESNPGYMFIVHPPLGKWCIALTSWIFGDNSFGWRAAPALAGTLSVLILTRVAMRMLRSTVLGVIAGLLLSVDGISLVVSRVALLDIFLQTFILAGFAALVLDREQLRARLGGLYAAGVDLSYEVPSLGPRPWRLLGGVLLGCAFGVKWSALSFWVGFAALSLLWDVGAYRSAGVRHPWRTMLKRSLPTGVFSLGVAGLGAYLLCWLGWFVGENSWNRHWGDTHPGSGLFGLLPSSLRSLLDYHHQAYLFHSHLYDTKSNPWAWLILGRPISFYYPTDPTGCGAAKCSREILLIGTPLEYWAFVPALIWMVWHWATTRDWRAGAVLLAFIVGWGVWLQNQRRTAFLFYMAPLMPYLVIGATLAVGALLSVGTEDRSVAALAGRHAAADDTTSDVGPRDDQLGGGLAEPAGLAEPVGLADDDVREVGLREWIRLEGIPIPRLLRSAAVTLWLGAVVADFIWMWPIFSGGLLTNAQWLQRMWFPSWI